MAERLAGAEPRVLVVTNMWPRPEDPAFGIFVAQQVEDLRRLGLQVETSFIDGRSSRWNYLLGIAGLRRQLRRSRPDLVHAHYVLSGWVALLAGARRRHRPLIVTHHGIEVFEGWQARLARWLSRRVDRNLVINRAMAERLDLPAEAVLPCGIDLEAFAPGDRSAARAALGIEDEAARVAWVGADRPEKRLGLARESLALLREHRPEARLHQVTGLPPEQVPLHLRACDALLVTSTREGGPLVVKEALAVGLPVVSTDVGDVRELLEGLPGCAVAEDRPEALARVLDRALAAGRIDARSRLAPYDRRVIAERLRDLYASLLEPRASA